ARSRGAEIAVQLRPVTGLRLAASLALGNAARQSELPGNSTASGRSGDRLPFSTRFSGNFAVDEELSLATGFSGFFGADVSYVGNRRDIFAPTEESRLELPGYALIGLHAGVRYETWTVNLFLNNLADKRGVLSKPEIGFTMYAVNYIQPRTAGLSISRSF